MWYVTPYTLLPLAAVTMSGLAVGQAWSYRHLLTARVFIGLMLSIIWWSLCNALELANATVSGKMLLITLQHVSVVSVPVLWLLFALSYANHDYLLKRELLIGLVAVQGLILLGAWTNEWHRLMWPRVELVYTAHGLWVLTGPNGPLWYVGIATGYSMVLVGPALMLDQARRSRALYRSQALSLLIGALLPWVSSVLFVLGRSPIPSIDTTPVAFALSGIAFTIAMRRYRALDLVPTARETIVDQMPDAMIVVDQSDRILDANPAAQTLTAAPMKPGAALVDVGLGWLVEQARDRFEGQFEVRQSRADGDVVYDLRCTVLRDRRGAPVGRIFVLRDVTLFKQAAQALQEAKEAAEAANQAKSAFLATMSHELRTPLTAILGYSEFAHELLLAQEQRELARNLERIIVAGRHLLTLINDILDFARIEANAMPIYPEPIHLPSLLDDAVMTAQALARRNHNTLTLEIEPDLPMIVADPIRLRQIVFNLLSNACKFTERGQIHVRCYRPRSDMVQIDVRDTGIGIDAGQLERLFQPFVQVDSSSTRRYGGTGLGLAISQRLCQAMGGEITAVSEPQRGSTFSVRLPLVTTDRQLRSAVTGQS